MLSRRDPPDTGRSASNASSSRAVSPNQYQQDRFVTYTSSRPLSPASVSGQATDWRSDSPLGAVGSGSASYRTSSGVAPAFFDRHGEKANGSRTTRVASYGATSHCGERAEHANISPRSGASSPRTPRAGGAVPATLQELKEKYIANAEHYPDPFPEDLEDTVPTVAASFTTTEDAIQTLISLASLPLDSKGRHDASDSRIEEVMRLPMATLLSRLAAEPRARRLEEYRDPPPQPHPSSTLLLLKKRLHDEYRQVKMRQRDRYLAEEEKLKSEHERMRDEILDKHRKALLRIGMGRASDPQLVRGRSARGAHAAEEQQTESGGSTANLRPTLTLPSSRAMGVLEKLSQMPRIANGGDKAHLNNVEIGDTAESSASCLPDAGSKRLAAFWKSKYERTCQQIERISAELRHANSEYNQISQLSGRDPSYLEKAMAAMRDGEVEELKRGDSAKQQFLMECRRRGLVPSAVEAKSALRAKNYHALGRSIRQTDGSSSPHHRGSPKKGDSSAVMNGDDSINVGQATSSHVESSSDYLLPKHVPYVESISENGYRVPIVREVGLRIEAARKELDILENTLKYVMEAIKQRELEFDEVQNRFSKLAGSVVLDGESEAVVASIESWYECESADAKSFESAMKKILDAREKASEATRRALVHGRSVLRAKGLEAELTALKQRYDIEFAQRKLLQRLPNDVERARLSYLEAQLTSLASERKLLRQEVLEAQRKAKGYRDAVEEQLKVSLA